MLRAVVVALALMPLRVFAVEAYTLVLNWVPNAEHAPLYYAERQGWFRDAGIDLTIDSVAGSSEAIKRAVNAPRTLAVSDFVAFVRARASKTPATAVMALQPRSPYAIYFRAGSGIEQPADLAGKRIGAMEQDPMRNLWIALAGRNEIDAARTRWVPLSNAQKPDALEAGEIDAALNPFLHNHLNYEAAFGQQMRVIWWHELGFPVPGQVLVAGRATMQASPDTLRALVAATQRAWHDCLLDSAPCLDALLQANPQLDRERETALWRLVSRLFDTSLRQTTLGRFGDRTGSAATLFVQRALALQLDDEPTVSEQYLAPSILVP